MIRRMFAFVCVLIVPASTSARPAAALPKEIAAAWEKAGAKVGTMRMFRPERLDFGPGEPAVLPAFYFNELSHGLLDTLPEPAVPFGIDLEGPYRGYGAGSNRRIVNGHLKGLERFKNLHAPNVARHEVTVAGMEIVGLCKNLRFLATDSDAKTNTSLRDLAGLRELRGLFLGSSYLGDIGMKSVAEFKELRELRLYGVPITDEGLQDLVGLTRLQVLNLTSTKVTDNGMKSIAQPRELRELSLGSTKVGDAGIARLSVLPKLKMLGLRDSKVTDAGRNALAPFHDLEFLDLDLTGISDAGLCPTSKLTKLKVLRLNKTKVTDVGLKHLADLRRLLVPERNARRHRCGRARLRTDAPVAGPQGGQDQRD